MYIKMAILLKIALLQLCCHQAFLISSFVNQNFDLKLVSVNSLNRSRPHSLEHHIEDTSNIERFAKSKGTVRKHYIWEAPHPTVGRPWPQPRKIVQRKEIYYFANSPTFITHGPRCTLIESTVNRYKTKIFKSKRVTHIDERDIPGNVSLCDNIMQTDCLIRTIKVKVTRCSNVDWPNDEMDESYTMSVKNSSILIEAEEVWGLLRALETLSQLVYCVISNNQCRLVINGGEIYDSPTYSYRGLLLDTSRHFIPFDDTISILDAMEMNKLNVLHWHLTDDQSFTFGSILHPELYLNGSYDPLMVYNRSMIMKIVQYARQRGIRVIPEMDTPAHTYAISKSHPEIFSQCIEYNGNLSSYGPLNPVLNETFTLLLSLYRELISWFPDKYIHIGMDEIEYNCWYTDPSIIHYMKENKIRYVSDLTSLFIKKLQTMINDNFPGKKMIVWEEAIHHWLWLSENTIIQVWKSTSASDIKNIKKKGFPIIYSSSFYLDRLEYGPPWIKFYSALFGNKKEFGFIGGEACMWNEFQSKETIHHTIWPAASAVAEKLWYGSVASMVNVGSRLEEQRCRMLRRGIPVGVANGPSECKYLYEDSIFYNDLGSGDASQPIIKRSNVEPNLGCGESLNPINGKSTNFKIHSERTTISQNFYDLFPNYLTFFYGFVIGYFARILNSRPRRYIVVLLCVMITLILWIFKY